MGSIWTDISRSTHRPKNASAMVLCGNEFYSGSHRMSCGVGTAHERAHLCAFDMNPVPVILVRDSGEDSTEALLTGPAPIGVAPPRPDPAVQPPVEQLQDVGPRHYRGGDVAGQ